MSQVKGLSVVTLAMPGRITANTNGAQVDMLGFSGDAILHMRSTGTEGAGQTMDIKIQHSPDGTTWTDATMPITGAPMAFTTITNVATSGQSLNIHVDDLHRYVRAVQTLGGTSPAGAAYVSLTAHKRVV